MSTVRNQRSKCENTEGLSDFSESDSGENIGRQFANVIDRLYLMAISLDASPRSHFAYACFLETHGRYEESLREFNAVNDGNKDDEAIRNEIASHIGRIEKRMLGAGEFEMLEHIK